LPQGIRSGILPQSTTQRLENVTMKKITLDQAVKAGEYAYVLGIKDCESAQRVSAVVAIRLARGFPILSNA